MTEILQFMELGDGAAILVVVIIGWIKLHSRILRLEILINNDFRHRLDSIEERFRTKEGE